MILQTVSKQKTSLKVLFAVIFVGGFIYITGSFFVPVALGAIIGIVAFPLVHKMTERGWGKRVSALIVTLGITAAILVPTASLLIVGGQAAFRQLKEMKITEPGELENFAYSPVFRKGVSSLTKILGLPSSTFFQSARSLFLDFTEFLSNLLGDTIYRLPEIAIGFICVILAIYYFMVDGHRIVGFFRVNSPFDEEATEKIVRSVEDVSFSVVVATFLSALSQTLFMAFGVWITGTPNIALIGLFTFLCAFLPIVGTAPISIGVIAYHFALGHTTEGLVMIVVALIVSLVDNVVHLVVLRRRSQIHPLLGFVAVFGGLNVMGFGGIFIGPVLAAVTIELIPILIKDQRKQPPPATIEVAPQEIKMRRGPG